MADIDKHHWDTNAENRRIDRKIFKESLGDD